MAMIQGECPKCGKRVLHVNIENVVGRLLYSSDAADDLQRVTPGCLWSGHKQ